MGRLGKEKGSVALRAPDQWRARPVAAYVVWLTTAALPIVAAVCAGVAVTTLWARPQAVAGQLQWWVASVGAAAAASYVVALVARRFLPLATLLKLSLSFPDRTPSRFALALRAGRASDLRARGERLATANLPLAEAVKEAVLLAAALTRHDRATRGHSERVRAMTEILADELGLSADDRDRLRWAGLLHDVGKVMVPATILNKPGPLTDEEWTVMRTHPAASGRMVAPLRPWLGRWTDAVAQHHERYDGSGYPDGLRGDHINFGARIVAVADTFEVMTSPRSYKPPLPADIAREEISTHAGDLFDPAVARALLNVSLGRLRWVGGPLLWITLSPIILRFRARTASISASASSSIAGAAGGVLAAALAVAPAAPVATATVPAPPMRLVRPSAVVPTPQTAAAVASPASAAAPRTAAHAAAVAPNDVIEAGPGSPPRRLGPVAVRTRTGTPSGAGPTSAGVPPLLQVSAEVHPLSLQVTTTVHASPPEVSVQVASLPTIQIGGRQ